MRKKFLNYCVVMSSLLILAACQRDSERVIEVRENYDPLTEEEVGFVAHAIEEGLSGHYDIRYDEDYRTFYLELVDGHSHEKQMDDMLANPEDYNHKVTLQGMAYSMTDLSNTLTQEVGEGIRIALIHSNEDTPLYFIEDGEAAFPYFEEE